mmetsp:Transcript_73706/g.90446  ORF Transcript_73706/g.90446 Transcript_73706/m.90446 type:complete len:98 (-) Transcript_73706:184-477(-)
MITVMNKHNAITATMIITIVSTVICFASTLFSVFMDGEFVGIFVSFTRTKLKDGDMVIGFEVGTVDGFAEGTIVGIADGMDEVLLVGDDVNDGGNVE